MSEVNCPVCGASTSQAPNGSWYCGNCGWQSGFVPSPAVQWLEAEPPSERIELLMPMFSIKPDHEAYSETVGRCYHCRRDEATGALLVVG